MSLSDLQFRPLGTLLDRCIQHLATFFELFLRNSIIPESRNSPLHLRQHISGIAFALHDLQNLLLSRNHARIVVLLQREIEERIPRRQTVRRQRDRLLQRPTGLSDVAQLLEPRGDSRPNESLLAVGKVVHSLRRGHQLGRQLFIFDREEEIDSQRAKCRRILPLFHHAVEKL